MDVVGLPVPEDVTDLLAREHGRSRPSHIPRLQPVPLRLLEVDLDLDLGDVGLELDVLIHHAVDRSEDLADLIRLRPDHLEIVAEDAHHDRVA